VTFVYVYMHACLFVCRLMHVSVQLVQYHLVVSDVWFFVFEF